MNRTRYFLLSLLALVALQGGCARVPVPRIDPTGQSVFLPGTQTLGLQEGFGCGRLFPKSAFPTPPQPPTCPPFESTGAPNVFAPGSIQYPAAATGQAVPTLIAPNPTLQPSTVGPQVGNVAKLLVTPQNLVAPVGSSITIAAGLTRGAGYFPNEPIEWVMSQGSTGYIIESAPSPRGFSQWLRGDQTGLLSNSYARGRTSTTATRVAQGTADPTDDLLLVPGQHWIRVSSPVDGTSRLAVTARGASEWDGQVQTATIHWVDATWELPASAIVEEGKPHTLTTIVRKANGEPLPGYLVRYEIADGTPAGFGPELSGGAEVVTDAAGQANVQIARVDNAGGSSQVRIQILRPGMQADANPLLLGEGDAVITWNAPALVAKMTGPQTANLGDTINYRVEVSNPGDQPATGVTVTDILPPALTVLQSVPAGAVFGNQNRWTLGNMPPGAVQTIDIQCRAGRAGDVNYCVRANCNEGVQSEACAATRISAPAPVPQQPVPQQPIPQQPVAKQLEVTMTGPETAKVGDTIQYRIEVKNVGSQTLPQVTMVDTFGSGLRLPNNAPSPLMNRLGDLAPGESKKVGLDFQVVSPGRNCHVLEVGSSNGERETREGCVTAAATPEPDPRPVPGPRPVPTPLTPAVSAELIGPPAGQVGSEAKYTLKIRNTGNTPLTNVKVSYEFTPAMLAKFAPPNRTGFVEWPAGNIEIGGTREFQWLCELERPTTAFNRVTVTTQEQASDTSEMKTQIIAIPGSTGPRIPTDGNSGVGNNGGGNVSGGLAITVVDRNDPIKPQGETSYIIVIKNDRNVSDKEVTLVVDIPPELRFVGVTGPTEFARMQGTQVVLKPIKEMRANETLAPYTVKVTGLLVGKATLRASVFSQRSPGGVEESETTTINSP